MTLYLCICGLATDNLQRLDDHLTGHPGHYERDAGRTAADTDSPVPEPPHPLGQLTTCELADYRRTLDTALRETPAASPAQDRLRQLLGEVITEQDQRAQAARDSCADEAARALRRDALHA